MSLARLFMEREPDAFGPDDDQQMFSNNEQHSNVVLNTEQWEFFGMPDEVTVIVMPGRVPSHLPISGDSIERWLRAHRDKYPEHSSHWIVMNLLLENYMVCEANHMPLNDMTEMLKG